MSRKTILPKRINRRSFFIVFCVFLVYGYLIYRIFDIQFVKGKEYKESLEKQNTTKVTLNSGRGTIFDRNNKPLTDTKKRKLLIIDKNKMLKDKEISDLILDATKNLSTKKDFLYNVSSSYVEIEIDSIDFNLEKKLEEKGIIIEDRVYRYDESGILSHTIGYINESENKGVSGIEKDQKEILDNSNEKYLSVFKAGQVGGNVGNKYINNLEGTLEIVEDKKSARHIKTTIDLDIQKEVEKIVDKESNPTAVVVSDVETGEILAISSRPNFDQYNVQNYLKSTNKELINRATQMTYQPASVFKIVVLFSALENNIIDESYTYNCIGTEKVKNSEEEIKCINNMVHGYQTLTDAFSNSCNTAFLDIANKMNDIDIINTAKKLHLVEKVDIGVEEAKGNVDKNTDSRNLPIGQGSIEVTPLQINQMTQIIANNGTYKPLYIYDSVIDSNKNIVKIFRNNKEEEIISPFIVTRVKEIMKEVSNKGTAKILNTLEKGSGTKTGTSQVKINNKDTNNWLITGFYPANSPKYSITVVVEGVGDIKKDSNKSAVPIFKEICEYLEKK